MQLRRPDRQVAPYDLVRASIPCPEFSRFLYTTVGYPWTWQDRLGWSYERWRNHLDRMELQTWVAYLQGTPAGYFELELDAKQSVEIAYFGLLPGFIGKGIGGHLLTDAIDRAFDLGSDPVWVHTCTLDHPQALANYLARGFEIYKEVEDYWELPDRPLEPWPGARA